MRLERLEISGFKSFSDRSELAFDKGVTAIVGPNGCGKSNVADAITWVMGEQSAKSLRGDRMEDVIFSGSDARRPTASAEVRLRLSGVVKAVTAPAFEAGAASGNGQGNGHGSGYGNGNGRSRDVGSPLVAEAGLAADELIRSVAREVEVTRRLYRSGESEYLIDGQTCRLRDVHELLMDTGLGAKAYAIIEQGKIGLILSSRPTDRRQLIEEAAGVTKYKARRRAAELKLEAAQLNLTRIDDIVFEVEKQRGMLKRQAAKARRYQRLRDQLRRWEKVLLARRYRQLADTILVTRTRLNEAREREAAAAAHVGELDADVSRLRIELVEAESRATQLREAAHARELAITQRQQQTAVEREQLNALAVRSSAVAAELDALEGRRGPARTALDERRTRTLTAELESRRASQAVATGAEACEAASREIEGLEADVEAARSEVFSAINAATALSHSLDHAAAAQRRVAETLSKLAVEQDEARVLGERVAGDHLAAAEGLRDVLGAIETARLMLATREAEFAGTRAEHEARLRALRSREQELAGLEARLQSLEEVEAARTQYGDAARTVLALADEAVGQRGALADYLDVEPGYERAVEACLGERLQYVLVERSESARAGLELLRQERAGRCTFLIADAGAASTADAHGASNGTGAGHDEGLVPLASTLRITGPFADAIRVAVGDGWIAETYEGALRSCRSTSAPVATKAGELFRGPRVVTGGSPEAARGILETRRTLLDLRRRIQSERAALTGLAEEATAREGAIVRLTEAISSLLGDLHGHEKAAVAHEARLQRVADELLRLEQRSAQLARERRQAEEERDGLERRQLEARASISRLEGEQRAADERLTEAQRRLFEAREAAQDLSRHAAETGATYAALVERASALQADVRRLEEALEELETRASSLAAELDTARDRSETLRSSIAQNAELLDADARVLEELRDQVRQTDVLVAGLRGHADTREAALRAARLGLDSDRGVVTDLDLIRATAERDLGHLAEISLDTVQATLDEVAEEVGALEAAGLATPDARGVYVDEADETEEGAPPPPADPVAAAERRTLSAEEAIADLRGKIDRLGPVNMMAIEQFDELESRHAFLATQRRDLVDSIAQTGEAIRRIDDTTRQRFAEAFHAINRNFQETFSTLFGGGRAGLTMIDESDPLETGIEIIAQPPGKRLQSVQLLSGGEKALTAIALMFALFKYKPSPFCLLDEIDAPLDDANIARFVEMLTGMLQHTQFILITHNRKTMEIADRLYGVTMEEPGVSKLISVQLN